MDEVGDREVSDEEVVSFSFPFDLILITRMQVLGRVNSVLKSNRFLIRPPFR